MHLFVDSVAHVGLEVSDIRFSVQIIKDIIKCKQGI